MNSRFAALAYPQFRRLWIGQSLSAIGDGLVPVVVAVAAIQMGSGARGVGIVLACSTIPRIALIPAGGLIADRFPRRRVMIGADAVRLGSQVAIAFLLLRGVHAVALLALLCFVYSIGVAAFRPAYIALIPDTTGGRDLASANGLVSITVNVGYIVGPSLAGVIALGNLAWAFLIDAFTFALSIASLARLREDFVGFRSNSVRQQWTRGLDFMAHRAWLRRATASYAVFNFAFAACLVLAPVIAVKSLGGPSAWGIICASAGAGAVVGGVGAASRRSARPVRAAMMFLPVFAVEPIALAATTNLSLVCLAAAVAFAGIAASGVYWSVALQSNVPAPRLALASSMNQMGALCLTPIAYVGAGLVAHAAGTTVALSGIVALAFLAPLLARGIDAEPSINEPAAIQSEARGE